MNVLWTQLHIEREREREGRENGGKGSELTHIERWGKQRDKKRERDKQRQRKGQERDKRERGCDIPILIHA